MNLIPATCSISLQYFYYKVCWKIFKGIYCPKWYIYELLFKLLPSLPPVLVPMVSSLPPRHCIAGWTIITGNMKPMIIGISKIIPSLKIVTWQQNENPEPGLSKLTRSLWGWLLGGYFLDFENPSFPAVHDTEQLNFDTVILEHGTQECWIVILPY